MRPDAITFRAGLDHGRARASAGVERIITDPALRVGSDGRLSELSLDWAVLVLERQLYDGGWLRPVELAHKSVAQRAASENWELAQAGYSGDRRESLSRNQSCIADGLAADGRVVLHLCDATFGDSGSPIFVFQNGTYQIAAVHVAVVRLQDGNQVGAAVIPGDVRK